jgi:signal transduction histidine kinase
LEQYPNGFPMSGKCAKVSCGHAGPPLAEKLQQARVFAYAGFSMTTGNVQMLARDRSRASKGPWFFAVGVCVFGTLLSFAGWGALRRIERRAVEEEFRTQAAAMAQRIAREAGMVVEVLDSLSHLHTLSDRISQEDFAEFVAKGMRFHRDVLGAFGFVQQIDEEMRVLLETSDTNSLRILRRDPENPAQFVGAPPKGVYFPLTYQYPEDGLRLPLGFDFSTVPEYADAIARLLNTGRPVLGGPAPDGASGGRFFLFAPIVYVVMSQEDGNPVARSLAGFTVGLFCPQEIVERALGGERNMLERAGWKVEWGFLEKSPSPETARRGRPVLTYDADIKVADAPWRVRLGADLAGFLPPGRRPSTVALAVGLAITALLTFELLLLAGRGRRIEKLVETRTAALREAKEQLEREMRRRAELEQEIIGISTREKVRVGQDLHDSLGQKLTGAVLLSSALSRRVAKAAPESTADAEALHELLKDSVSQVRRMARGLAPVELGERGLVGALEQLVEDAREAAPDIECELKCPAVFPSLAPKTAQHLYHIAQEAVTNALRHAQARRIIVNLRTNEKAGELIIEDDGRGFDPERHDGNGLGLEIMKHRADLIGARLEFASSEKGGTRITCFFQM